ncbi:MAG: 4-(cytidine 5'-diphospho)-2-C-methyl-D-erythritol kinase [Candidatus Omnitrophica bacterium]|nr:4-(cytidine 5'-diphospho)-2-C-methyl-D-erythritol kinase [Candidatus Omnitrophota bacterium]
MTSIELTAPAKVNLVLKILGKRKDSYHNIYTLFEKISLCDRIRITKIREGIIVSSDRFITRSPKDNLVYKAAKLFLGRHKLKYGVKIDIKKKIPIAGGLGGGSSDAASVLMGMDRLFGLKIGRAGLLSLAARLGSDVPFFILDVPFAVGRGRGERLEKADVRKRLWHLIIYPGFKVSTKDVYEAFDAHQEALVPRRGSGSGLKHLSKASGVVRLAHHTSNHPELSRGKLLPSHLVPRRGSGSRPEHLPKALTTRHCGDRIIRQSAGSMDFGEIESMLYNDLEETVIAKKETIGKVIERLASSLNKKAIVSGSGPSVFCLYRDGKEALAAKRRLLGSLPAPERASWQVFVAKTEK